MDKITQTVFQPAPGILAQEIHGEVVLLDLNGEEYFGLNQVGARVWTLLNEALPGSAVIKVLQAEYEVDAATLEKDVIDLIRRLIEKELITEQSMPAMDPG